MFDVGFWELAIIGIVALLILGPERLPQAARTAGLWIGKARRMLGELKADFDREIREHTPADLESVKHDIESAGGAFQQAAQDVNEAMQVDKPNDKPGANTVKTNRKKTRGKKTVGKASGNKRGGNVVKKHIVKKRAVKKPIGNKRVIKKRTVKKPITNKRKR